MLKHRLLILCSGVIFSGFLSSCTSKGPGGSTESPAPVPEPLAVQSETALGYVAIPSLDGLLKNVIAFVDVVQPGAVNEMMLTAQIGSMVGDPDLSTLHRDRPIVLVVLKGATPEAGAPPVALFVPAKDGSPIEQSVSALGLQAKRSGGVLLLAETGEAIAAAEKVQAVYDKIVAAKAPETLRIYVNAGRLMDAYRPLLDAQLAALSGMAEMFGGPAQPGGMSIATILKAEVQGLLAVLSQCGETQVSVSLGSEGVSFDTVLVAKPGSSMGKFFAGSSQSSHRAPAFGGGAPGSVTGSCSIDAKALGAVTEEIVRDLAKDPELAAILTPALTDMWTSIGDWWTGTAHVQYGFSEKGLTYSGVMGVADETKFMELIRRSVAMMGEGGAFHDMYRSMGMDLSGSFTETTREHAGVSIREWAMTWKSGAPGVDIAEMLKLMPSGWNLAVVDGNALFSTTGAGIDRMIDDAKAGRESSQTPEAARVFGGGQQALLDIDFLDLLKSMSAHMPGPGAAMFQGLAQSAQDSSPVSVAVSFEDNRMRLQTRVPSALVRMAATVGTTSRETIPAPAGR